MNLAIEFELPGYRVNDTLSGKGKSLVFRGERVSDDLPVVLKVLHGNAQNLKALARLRHETELLQSLHHPALIKAYELKHHQGTYVLVLEDIGGHSLYHYLSIEPFPLRMCLDLFVASVEQLALLHQNGVIHKDINPSNIVYHPESGCLRIIDFSIASRFSKEQQKLTAANLLEGTLAYISPEQTGRMNRAVDYRTDFYSLGVTFYQLLSGRLPFSGSDPLELLHGHIAHTPSPVHELNNAVPLMLSRIVEKLMAKNPEERYQSCFGLQSDLERCRQQLNAGGGIENFALGDFDRIAQFEVAQTLVGRKHELEVLDQALNRVSQDGIELLLITGKAGVGKSALIHEMYKSMAEYRGYLVFAKFDSSQTNRPFACLIQACRSLTRQLLSESGERLSFWRERMFHVLGASVGIVMEVIPELAHALGPSALPRALPTAETENRFHLAMQKFLSLFVAKGRPLVLVFDDIQWADPASLKLIRTLLKDRDLHSFLVVGIYRDDEIDQNHCLAQFERGLALESLNTTRLHLNVLGLEELTEIVAQTLHARPQAVAELAAIIQARTGGNPFFVGEFLKALHAEQLLVFDKNLGIWTWNLKQVEHLNLSEDAISLTAEKIRRLPVPTRHLIELAACVGSQFDLKVLARICHQESSNLSAQLGLALDEGLIIPLNPGAHEVWEQVGSERLQPFEFLHDQVRLAAYSLLDVPSKAAHHLALGHYYLELFELAPSDEQLFTLVNHLNLGSSLILEPALRLQLVALNTRAGRNARIAGAIETALRYLKSGLEHLGENPWQQAELARPLVLELAICQYLWGEIGAAEDLFDQAQAHSDDVIERASVFRIRTMLYAHSGKYVEAMEVGMHGLKVLGIHVPDRDDQLRGAIANILSAIREKQGQRSSADLMALPQLEDPLVEAILQQLVNLWSPAANVNLNLLKYLVLKIVDLSLKHGNTDVSSYGYVGYALVLGSGFGDYRAGEAFGELGIHLNQQFENLELKCRVYFVHGALVKPWRGHIRESVPLLSDAYQAGLASGDILWASQCLLHRVLHRLLAGDPLNSIERDAIACFSFLQKGGYEQSLELLLVVQHLLRCLRDPLEREAEVPFDEKSYLTRNQRKFYLVAVNHFYTCKAQIAYLFGDYLNALTAAERADKFELFKFGWPSLAEHILIRGLISAALWHETEGSTAEAHIEIIHDCLGKLQQWAEANPANFRCRCLLLAGEAARVMQGFEKALDYYDEAIEDARRHEFTHIEALANERAGRFLLSRQKPRLAQVYLREACFQYGRWDALAKVLQLETEFKEVLGGEHVSTAQRMDATTTTQDEGGNLDMTTFMKASLTISSEIHLDRLLAKLMRIALEYAGAQAGYLLLHDREGLFLEAAGNVDDEEVEVLQTLPLAQCEQLAQAVVHYVYHTRESMVLGNAAKEGQFTADPYIRSHQIKSLLCQPIHYKGRLAGILYLENNRVSGAFTPRRREILQMIVSEAAISIENARLYSVLAAAHQNLHESNAQLAHVNQSLEVMVAERTSELSEKNEKLALTLSQLQMMQQQIIQQEKMASLGTLSAGIAHEIRNPLNFVNNFADISCELIHELRDHLTSDAPDRIRQGMELIADLEKNLNKIFVHGRRADDIVQSMLLQSHNKTAIRPSALDINDLLRQSFTLASETTRAEYPLSPILVWELDPDLASIEGVPDDLIRVFVNLADNAIYSMYARAHVSDETYIPELLFSSRDCGDEVEIHLRDNGRGISPQIQAQIFNPFFTTKPAGKGTGLGLSISYDIIVKEHQGQISVDSEPDDFTDFKILLPKQLYKPQAK